MPSVNVNDVNWENFFPPNSVSSDYIFIALVNDARRVDGFEPDDDPYGRDSFDYKTIIQLSQIDPDEIIKFLALDAHTLTHFDPSYKTDLTPDQITYLQNKVAELQERLRAYQAIQFEKLRILEARDDTTQINRTAIRLAGIVDKTESKDTIFSPFSGGHVVPRDLTEKEAELFNHQKTGPLNLTSFNLYPFDKHPSVVFHYNPTTMRYTLEFLRRPYNGPTITIVSMDGDVFKIKDSESGCIELSAGDVIQIGDDTPVYLSKLLIRVTGPRLEIPVPLDILENQFHYDFSEGKVVVKLSPTSVVEPTPGHIFHGNSGNGRIYKISYDDIAKEINYRNALNEALENETHKANLRILELSPKDLLGKTPQQMLRIISDAGNTIFSNSDNDGGILQTISYEALRALDELRDLIKEGAVFPAHEYPAVENPKKIYKPNRAPTPPEATSAPVTNRSLAALFTSMWLTFSPTADLEAIKNAATLPQHSIELSADSETREGNSHPSNDRRVSERPAALARKSRALEVARSKTLKWMRVRG